MSTAPKQRALWVFAIVACIMILAGIVAIRFFSEPVRIGFILPIDTSLGNEENLFTRYYQHAHSRFGHRSLEFIIENPPSTKEAVRAAYERLDQLGVSVIIGGVLSKDGLWLAEESMRSGIPTFGITSSSAVLSGRKDSFFRLCPNNDAQARAVATSFEARGSKRLLLVTAPNNAAYVDPYVHMLTSRFTGNIHQVMYTSENLLSHAIAEYKPDSLFCILPASALIQVITLVRSRDQALLIGSASWGSTEILSLYSGPMLDGVLFFSLGLQDLNEELKIEISGFENQYGMTATNGSMYLISIMHLIFDAIEAVGPSRERLKAWFEEPRTYETAYGLISMDASGDSTRRETIILQTANGELRSVEVIKDRVHD